MAMAMGGKIDSLEGILNESIQFTKEVCNDAQHADSYRNECLDLKHRASRIADLLNEVRSLENTPSSPLYTRPLRRMIIDLQKSVNKALILIQKCNKKGLIRRVITIISSNDFRRVNNLLDNTIADLTWFINISRNEGAGGMPPIASSEPALEYCWSNLVILHKGSPEDQETAVNALYDYARNNDRFMNVMLQEEAVVPLLRVLQEGTVNAREIAATTLGDMAKDGAVVEEMAKCGLVPAFVKVLNNAAMRVQVAVARAMAHVLDVDSSLQYLFLEHHAVRPLVSLLGESLDEPQRAKVPMTMHALVSNVAVAQLQQLQQEERDTQPWVQRPSANSHITKPASVAQASAVTGAGRTNRNYENGKGLTQREIQRRERENEDPNVKERLKIEVARALGNMAKGSKEVCRSITETRALLCLATLMEKATGELQYCAARAVMEITAVAENAVDLRRASFKMSSQATKAVVEQLLRLVEEGRPELQVACIRAIGCLSHTFSVKETRVVAPLVKQLENVPEEVSAEAVKALMKFASKDNFLHKEHSKAIFDAGGAAPLLQISLFSKGDVKMDAVTLMCCLVLYSGEAATLAKESSPLPALKLALKNSFSLQPSADVIDLLTKAIDKLESYHG